MNGFKDNIFWQAVLGKRCSNMKYLFLVLIPNLLAALLEGSSFAFIYLAFTSLDSKTIHSPEHFQLFKSSYWGFNLTPTQEFYYFIFLSILCQSLRGIISFISLSGTSLFSLNVQINIQTRVYKQIFRFSFPFVSKYKTGDLIEYAKAPGTFIPPLFEFINKLLVSFFMSIGLLSALCFLSIKLTFLTLILFSLFALFQKTLIKKVMSHSTDLTSHLFEFSHQVNQSLQGIRAIHVFHKQKYILERINSLLFKISQTSKNLYFWNNFIATLNETVNIVLVGMILFLGSVIFFSHESVLPSLLTYIALTYRLATRIQTAIASISSASVYYGPIKKLNEFLSDDTKEYDKSPEVHLSKWADSLRFNNVSLHYPSNPKPTLKNLSFEIQKGTSLAIVGLSGAGKSSLLDLIIRLQKPTGGEITIDSLSLDSFSHESWRKILGVVSQDIFIFNGSIEENIRFGDSISSAFDIKEAAKLAGASEFIEALPHGYNTVVGEKGYRLSGGERQRIALARVLLKNPEILILDEATSNLDSYSESVIQKSIESLSKTKTVIVVAHRLSTIINSNEILVLKEGSIIERGTHSQLLSLNGLYQKLWSFQSGTTTYRHLEQSTLT